MNIIEHSETILKSFDIEPKPIDRILSAYLKKHKVIGGSERRLISEIVFGVMRWSRRLDGYLQNFCPSKATWRNRILCYLQWKHPEGSEKLNLKERAGKLLLDADFDSVNCDRFPGGMAAYYSMPDFLYREIMNNSGIGDDSGLTELNEPLLPVLRVNSSRARREEVISKLKESEIGCGKTEFSPFGIRLDRRVNLETVSLYKDGILDVQDEASQLATLLAFSNEDQRVLDFCAGAGGKSLMLADLMKGRGRIFSSDIDSKKLKTLYARAKRMNAERIETISKESLMGSGKLKGSFDVVLIDAPCSGTGTIRRNPDLKWRLDEKVVSDRKKIQLELLSEATQFVAGGGRIVYLTCSLMREENEGVVGRFLEGNANYALEEPEVYFRRYSIRSNGIVDGKYFRTNPAIYAWDGFFGASVVKK